MRTCCGRAAHLDRKTERLELALDRMGHVDHHVARDRLFAFHRLAIIQDRRGWHAGSKEGVDPFLTRARQEGRREILDQHQPVLNARRVRRITRIVLQFGPADHVDEGQPQPLIGGADNELAVRACTA